MTRVLRADRRGAPVRPAAVLDAESRARMLLEDARTQAEALRERARVAGVADARAELAAAHVRLAADRDAWLDDAQARTLDVALQAAAHLVGEALDARPERIASVVRPLLARLRHAGRVVLRVHPQDGPALAAWVDAGAFDEDVPRALVIEHDADVRRGGCVLESDAGTLDARLEVRIDALRRALSEP